MTRLSVLGVVVVALLAGGWLLGDDTKKTDDTKDTVKVRGQLPQNWGKLGLTDEQKQKIYKVQNDIGAKIDKLEQQIADLKKDQKTEMEKVLTDAQKKRLKEILAEKGPADPPPAKDKKP